MSQKNLDNFLLIEELLTNVICKENNKAYLAESPDTEINYKEYITAIRELDTIGSYSLTAQEIHTAAPNLSALDIDNILNGNINIEHILTSIQLSTLLSRKRAERINSYYEENDYYRMLLGLPPMTDTIDDYVYYEGIPVHEMPLNMYYSAKQSGFLDVIIKKYPDKKYLFFIGKNIDLVFAREAGDYDIIYAPDDSIYTEFREIYNKERNVFLKTIHSKHLVETTDYTEVREMTSIKLQATLVYLIKKYSTLSDKTSYTHEEAVSIWKEFGFSFPKFMIEEYRNSCTFLLHFLVYMKGTNAGLDYIVKNIFTGIKLYKYMIRKRHKTGLVFPIPEDTPLEDIYEVDFILRPFYAPNVVDYSDKELDDQILTYDEVVQRDPRWRDTKELKDYVFGSKFSYTDSKYLSLNNYMNLTEFSHLFSVLSRIFIEHKDLLKTLNIYIPSTRREHNLFDGFVFILALVTKAMRKADDIIPDTTTLVNRLVGLQLPENMALLKTKFIWFFMQTDYAYLLDKYPDILNENDSFMLFLTNVDEVIGLDTVLYEAKITATNITNYDVIEDIVKILTHVKSTPSSYGEGQTVDGMKYVDWLLKYNGDLYISYMECQEDNDSFVVELDTALTQLNALFKSYEDKYNPHDNLAILINNISIITNGITRYLTYILNLFKAYSTDFFSTSTSYYTDERHMSLSMIDGIQIRGTYFRDFFESYSVNDAVLIERNTNIIEEELTQYAEVLLVTPAGDIKINN